MQELVITSGETVGFVANLFKQLKVALSHPAGKYKFVLFSVGTFGNSDNRYPKY